MILSHLFDLLKLYNFTAFLDKNLKVIYNKLIYVNNLLKRKSILLFK